MAITRWDPFVALGRMDREFDDLVRRGWGAGGATRSFVPPVEMLTRDTDAVIRLELPGVDVERDVEISVDRNKLIIRGERREERHDAEGGVLVRELRYGSFRREFALPDGVDAERIDASYDQGMLEVLVRGVVTPEPKPQQVAIRRTDSPRTIEAGPGDSVTG
jgi:HSP20 family protein